MNKTILTTNKTVSNKTTNNNTKGINTMKKLIVAATLMVGAAFASFAAVQYDYNPGAVTYNTSGSGIETQVSFTFDAAGKYDLIFGYATSGETLIPLAFGYYFIDGPDAGKLVSGQIGGNYSDHFNSWFGQIDINTGYLGTFNAGDTIGLWVQYGPMLYKSTDIPVPIGADDSGIIFCGNTYFAFNEVSGSPLPGVWAALAIGGCAFLGRKIRGRALRSN